MQVGDATRNGVRLNSSMVSGVGSWSSGSARLILRDSQSHRRRPQLVYNLSGGSWDTVRMMSRCGTEQRVPCCPRRRYCCAGTSPRTPNCSCCGMRTRCCDGISTVWSATSLRTGWRRYLA
jgi:hypothetical protein